MRRYLLLLLCLLVLAGCLPERPAPVLKVGLLAPFEGERRELGYHLLPAIFAATPERVNGQLVEWVILDTSSQPEVAAQRARELLVDPAVLAIVGPLLPEEVAAVAPLMEEAGVAWVPLAPRGEAGLQAWSQVLERVDEAEASWGPQAWPAIRRGEVTEYVDASLPADLGDFAAVAGAQPWPQDWLAWQGTRHAMQALDRTPTLNRAAVLDALEPFSIPAPALYETSEGLFPGNLLAEQR